MSLEELYPIIKEYEEKHRFDNAHPDVKYYADGWFFNKDFFVYQKDPIWGGISWVQSGYRSVEQLERFDDFQERL